VLAKKEKEFLKKVGQCIRKHRQAKNMSQEQLAFDCDVDISQINRMELGKVNASILSYKKIGDTLGLSLHDIFIDIVTPPGIEPGSKV
jgi:transcriptional regulator with XRE-family HTH domain